MLSAAGVLFVTNRNHTVISADFGTPVVLSPASHHPVLYITPSPPLPGLRTSPCLHSVPIQSYVLLIPSHPHKRFTPTLFRDVYPCPISMIECTPLPSMPPLLRGSLPRPPSSMSGSPYMDETPNCRKLSRPTRVGGCWTVSFSACHLVYRSQFMALIVSVLILTLSKPPLPVLLRNQPVV